MKTSFFAAALAATLVVASPSAHAQGVSINENFNNNALPASLEESGPSPSYSNGAVSFQGDRRYLRTLANYNNTSFIAEATVTVSGDAEGIGFIGLGAGVADPDFWGEPRISPTTYVRITPSGFGAAVSITTSTQENIGVNEGDAGDGTHRIRITWDHAGKVFTMAFHKNYAGGPFVPTVSVSRTLTEAFGNTNSRIFFGGAGNATFDDVRVLALAGTAGASNCHGKSVSGLAAQFGGINNATSALGYGSVDELQKLITNFCGK